MLKVVSPGAGLCPRGGSWPQTDPGCWRGGDLAGGQGGGGWSLPPLLPPGLRGLLLQAWGAAVPGLQLSSLQS